MTTTPIQAASKSPRQFSWRRIGLCLVLAVITLQLIGSTYHKHKVAAQSGESVSCYIAANLPPDTSTAVSRLFAACSLYFCAAGPFAILDFISRREYFIPRSQAPPLPHRSV